MSMNLTIDLRPDDRFEISMVYPELGRITFKAGDARFSFSNVSLEHMLELVTGNRLATYASLLSADHSTHGKSHTKQDIIDFIENLIADRELEAKVRAEMEGRKAQQEASRDTEAV